MKTKLLFTTMMAGILVVLPFISRADGLADDIDGLQSTLDGVYNDMIPLCGQLIGVGRAIAGFGALLDYSRRFYDPIIGRFTTVDPMSEKSRRFAVYAYCENNPIRNIDLDGMVTVKGGYGEDIDVSPFDTWSADGGGTVTYEGKSYNGLYSFFANNLDVAAAYNIQTGADLGISPFWSYMTKSDLVAFVKQIYPNLTPGSLQNTARQIFEKTFNNFMTTYSDKGYSPNTTAFPTDVAGRKAVIPDGISAAKFEVRDEEDAVLDRTLIPYVSWYEVKATASVISGSSFGNQAIGLVDALYKSNPVAAQEGYSFLVFVTTSDATISPRFVNQAKTGYNINLWQFRAIYRKTDDGIKVSFYDPDFAGGDGIISDSLYT